MRRPFVISLHGIRTRGSWQKELTKTLNDQRFDHLPLDYGFFGAVPLLFRWSRRRKVDWFRDRYAEAVRDDRLPSLIAHSLGTYIAAEAMRIYPDVRFGRIILCGSIVREDYPWTAIINAGSAERVLNDYGGTDFWAGIVAWAIRDAGPSGRHGFMDDAGGRVMQRFNPDWRHSDYFFDLNYRSSWVSFLRGETITTGGTAMPHRWNWRPLVAAALLVVTIVGIGFVWKRATLSTTPSHVTVATPVSRETFLGGTVVDERTGAVVPDATISAAGRRATSDSVGTFHLSIPASERVTVSAVADGFEAEHLEVSPPQSNLVIKLSEEKR